MFPILNLAVSFLSILPAVYAAPTLYICSDSTTANYAVGGALQGCVFPFLIDLGGVKMYLTLLDGDIIFQHTFPSRSPTKLVTAAVHALSVCLSQL